MDEFHGLLLGGARNRLFTQLADLVFERHGATEKIRMSETLRIHTTGESLEALSTRQNCETSFTLFPDVECD
jgi:hypothetical protein